MSNDSKWFKLYENDILNNGGYKNYYLKKIKYRKRIIDNIIKYSPGRKIMEAGCGSGVLSVRLAQLNNKVTAIDTSDDMLKIVDKINKTIGNYNMDLVKLNIFDLEKKYSENSFDTVFSVGVFEHFNDYDIIKLLNIQLSIANYVFVAVPTKYFDDGEALYGNERFMDYRKWRDILNKSNGKIIKEFSCYNSNIIGRLKNTKKYFRPAPIRVFIIRK